MDHSETTSQNAKLFSKQKFQGGCPYGKEQLGRVFLWARNSWPVFLWARKFQTYFPTGGKILGSFVMGGRILGRFTYLLAQARTFRRWSLPISLFGRQDSRRVFLLVMSGENIQGEFTFGENISGVFEKGKITIHGRQVIGNAPIEFLKSFLS